MMDKNLKIFFLFLFFFITSFPVISQNKFETLKRQAVLLMAAGRFSEAVDQLNKYIAANPREADGYHKRGLCYEQRSEYQYSVLDLRRAVRLDPQNSNIIKDLNRVIEIWHKQLYLKIDGHTRDIAINPKYAFSYLEIGKSYRWLEEWKNAEIWYDEYLLRDDNASPDEIIRYTEILAKNGSISKGEKILKTYTIRYPGDWRIWSKYGYFTLWLGKYKIAEDAFNTSLGFKPFFKEAEDGLDLAKKEGYLIQNVPRSFERTEYPIDRFYRLLEKNPDNDPIRFDLINELITANRIEEAFKQLQYLQPKHAEEDNFKTLWKNVTENRDSTYKKNIELYTATIKENPSDKITVLKLAETYANLFYYDSAIEVLSEYLANIPEDQDRDARFIFARYSAWNYEWEKAINQLNKLLELEPNNTDYQLLRGQIGAWTSVDLDISEQYLLNVLKVKPKEIQALIALGTIYSWKNNFPESKKYLDLAKSIEPGNSDVDTAINNYELRLGAFEESKIFDIRREAGRLAVEGKIDEAFDKYEEYIRKRKDLSREELIEFADICSAAKQYTKAIATYKKLMDQEFDYKLALRLAQDYYFIQDAANAKNLLENLNKIDPSNDETTLLLADTYAIANQLSKAEAIYRNMLLLSTDEKATHDLFERLANLGDLHVKNKNYEKADSLYNEIPTITQDPDIIKNVFDKQIYMSDALINDLKLDAAEKLLNSLKAKIKNEEQREVLNNRLLFLSDALIKDKKFENAEELFNYLKEIVKNDDQKKELNNRLLFLGDALISDKKLDNAEKLLDYLKVIIINDEQRYELNNRYLFLGDAYTSEKDYGQAKSIYTNLLEEVQDSAMVRATRERISWLPPSGFSRGLYGIRDFFTIFIPTNIGIAPFSSYYRDNTKFGLWNYGTQLDIGFVSFLSLGIFWSRSIIENSNDSKSFTQFRGTASILFSKYFSLSGSYGKTKILYEPDKLNGIFTIRYEKPEELSLSLSYENNDARLLFYSPNLIYSRLETDFYRFNGFYVYNNNFKISSYYNYFKLEDGNEGNDFQFRLGKKFLKNGFMGYEYSFADFAFTTYFYYSPNNFQSHSIWAEWNYLYKPNLKFKLNGKVGYVPSVDYVISELNTEISYKPILDLILTGRISYSNSYRFDSSYNNFSFSLFAYWSLF